MKITKYAYVVCGETGKPFVSACLRDSLDEFDYYTEVGMTVLKVVPVEVDLSEFGCL